MVGALKSYFLTSILGRRLDLKWGHAAVRQLNQRTMLTIGLILSIFSAPAKTRWWAMPYFPWADAELLGAPCGSTVVFLSTVLLQNALKSLHLHGTDELLEESPELPALPLPQTNDSPSLPALHSLSKEETPKTHEPQRTGCFLVSLGVLLNSAKATAEGDNSQQ